MSQLTRAQADANYTAQVAAVTAAQQAILGEIDTFLAALSPLVATFNAASAALKVAGLDFDPPQPPGVAIVPPGTGAPYRQIMEA